jgi:hypothetical protein
MALNNKKSNYFKSDLDKNKTEIDKLKSEITKRKRSQYAL